MASPAAPREYSSLSPAAAAPPPLGSPAWGRRLALVAGPALGALLLCGWLAGPRPAAPAPRMGVRSGDAGAEALFELLPRLLEESDPGRGLLLLGHHVNCSDYTCKGKAVCSVAARANMTVKLGEAQAKCCEKVECCKAPIAACLSCETCQSVAEFCTPLLEKWFPKPPPATTTAKPTLKDLVKSKLEKLKAGKAEGSRRLGDLEAASLEPPVYAPSAEALALRGADEREAAAEVARRLSEKADKQATMMALAANRAFQSAHGDLLKIMLGATVNATKKMREEEEEKRAAAAKPEADLPKSPGAWGKAWDEALAKAKASKHTGGAVPGCASVRVGGCAYYLESIFVLHRGLAERKQRAVNTVQVLADTLHAVSCGDDARCWVWKIRSATPKEVFVGHKGPVYTASVMADAGLIFSGGAALPWGGRGSQLGSGFVWRWRDGMPESKLISPTGALLASASIPASAKVITGAGKRNAYVASWRSILVEEVLHTLGPVNAASYVPTKRRFVTGHESGNVAYWNARTFELIRVIKGHRGPVNAVAGHPSRQWAFSGGEDGTVKLWDLEDGTPVRVFDQAYAGPVRSLAVVPGGEVVAVGADDGFIRLWQHGTGLLRCMLNTGGGKVLGLAVNPSNPMGQLLSANVDGYVRAFSPR